MTNGYEYIQVDPRVIKMLGGDESSTLNENLDGDLSADDITMPDPKLFYNKPVPNNMNNSNSSDELLRQILEELREIKVLLAGR